MIDPSVPEFSAICRAGHCRALRTMSIADLLARIGRGQLVDRLDRIKQRNAATGDYTLFECCAGRMHRVIDDRLEDRPGWVASCPPDQCDCCGLCADSGHSHLTRSAQRDQFIHLNLRVTGGSQIADGLRCLKANFRRGRRQDIKGRSSRQTGTEA